MKKVLIYILKYTYQCIKYLKKIVFQVDHLELEHFHICEKIRSRISAIPSIAELASRISWQTSMKEESIYLLKAAQNHNSDDIRNYSVIFQRAPN